LQNLAVIAAGNAPTSLVIKSVEKLYNEEWKAGTALCSLISIEQGISAHRNGSCRICWNGFLHNILHNLLPSAYWIVAIEHL
jgi:hypothetical protein